ncbi:MAG: hypothetical protein AB7N76_29565 [Planctomycetota bacterium]
MKRLSFVVPGLICSLALGAALSSTPRARAQDAPDDARSKLLHSVGSLGGFSAYSTCQYIGCLADALRTKTRPQEQLRAQLGGLRGGLRSELKELADLGKSLPAAEKDGIDLLTALNKDLAAEVEALDAYAQDPSPANAETFRAARKTAWDAVRKGLGFDAKVSERLEPGGATLGQ